MTPALSDAPWTHPEILHRLIEDEPDRAAIFAASRAPELEPRPCERSLALVSLRVTPLMRVPFWIRADEPADAARLIEAVTSAGHAPPVKLAPRPLMLVAGAHIGSACRQLLMSHPGSALVAVEALASNAAVCRLNLEAWNEHERRAGRAPPHAPSTIIHAAVWGEPGRVRIGGPSSVRVRVFQAGTAERPSTPIAGDCEAVTMPMLVDRALAQHGRPALDYVLMHISGSEGMVFESDLSWLFLVDVLRVRVSPPASIERVMHQVAATDMVVRRCPRDPSSVVAWSRRAAQRSSARGPRLDPMLEPPPPPI